MTKARTYSAETEESRSLAGLYERAKQRCYRAALAVTRSPQLAENAVQEAFVAVIRHREKILCLPGNKQLSLAAVIAKNKAVDIMRSEGRHKAEDLDALENISAPDGDDPARKAESREAGERLARMIKALPEIYAGPFEMRYMYDMSDAEIASLLGITRKLAVKRISRARAMLWESLDKEGELV
ncbi:MAG: RNA polymerase sigma factor [Oscillospiraceae bacterium]|jgi:RNA polymerase sigma-70 factor (ECF subfamily)|nr:RNA polymerase sigma factor [Oscillospiraceae bacterium]